MGLRSLINKGVRLVPFIDEGLDHLPLMQKGMRNAVHVKGEGTAINFGLRGGSVDVFNSRILDFIISPIK